MPPPRQGHAPAACYAALTRWACGVSHIVVHTLLACLHGCDAHAIRPTPCLMRVWATAVLGLTTHMKRIGYKLLLGLLLICPVCERGRMFATLFRMHRHCPRCRVTFEQSSGEATGAMAITLVVIAGMSMAIGIPLVVLTPISPWVLIGCLSIVVIVVGTLFYRNARGLWVSILYLFGALSER